MTQPELLRLNEIFEAFASDDKHLISHPTSTSDENLEESSSA